MIFREDLGTGYLYCYNPKHYCANSAGKVFEHIFVMAEAIGRKLTKDECVHHKDRDRKNNNLNNLQLLSIVEHGMLHAMEDKGVIYFSTRCQYCDSFFLKTNNSLRLYCCQLCARHDKKKFEISKEELEFLLWSKPTTEVAEIFGVSDVAIAKRAKKLGISKPPRGYWAKQYSLRN